MIILTKKRYCFRNGNDKFETAGGDAIETVPDWVAETELFELAVEGGNILEISSKGRKVSKAKAKAAEPETSNNQASAE
jgi:hypothetical protein